MPVKHSLNAPAPRSLLALLRNSNSRLFYFTLLTGLLGYTAGYSAAPALAEGSRTMYPNGASGNRANLHQASTSQLLGGKLKARTLLKVYVNAGEYINVGSSAVGVGSGDIQIFNPGIVTGALGQETLPATGSFQCSTQRASIANATIRATVGVINSRQKELDGPDTITNAVTAVRGNAISTGYVPCYYQAPQSGVYDIYFAPPVPSDSTAANNTTGEVSLASPLNFTTSQSNTVAAWDVTVRNSLTSTFNEDSRLFVYYAYMRHSNNSRYANFSLYPVTLDGYQYQTNLNGMDPNSWASFGNRSGFLDSDGVTPLYHDILGSDDSLTTITGGASIQLPQFPMFFNPPKSTIVSALGIPTAPIKPEITAFSFAGSVASNNSLVGAGGTFTFAATVDHSYEIVISRDGTDFDPTNINNRVLRGLKASGTNTVTWNGKDNSGIDFPVGTNYKSKIVIRNGEYHFPMADVENSLAGPSITMLNPPGGICPGNNCSAAFYDDRGYKLLNGTTIGTVNVTLPGGTAPSINYSGISGFTSTGSQRAFSNSFGDRKGLDIWTYFPSEAANLVLNVLPLAPDLTITKTHTGNFFAGQVGAAYTITVKNEGTSSTTGTVSVVDTLPTGLTATAATGPGWTCTLNTPSVGKVTCTTTTALAAGSSYPPIVLTVNVAANAPSSVINSVTTSVPTGELNTTNNTATDPTTINPLSIAGTVFNDGDGSKLKNGTEVFTNAGGLNAILVNSSNLVVATTTIAADGTYSFSNVPPNATYTVQITTATATLNAAPPAMTLPANWVSTGENLGGAIDGTVDSQQSVSVTTTSVTDLNFGIEQLPDTTNLTSPSQLNPGGTTTVQVPSLNGTDPEDGPLGNGKSFQIVTLPTNGTLTYNETAIVAGQTISNYDPTLLKLDPNNGAITVTFTYASVDAAGKVDPSPATVNMPFTLTAVASPPELILLKRITKINGLTTGKKADGTSIDLTLVVPQPDNLATLRDESGDASNPGWMINYPKGAIDGGIIKSGDQIEYAIYFLSSGGQPVTNANFCDWVPKNTVFEPDSYGVGKGIELAIGSIVTALTNIPDYNPTAIAPFLASIDRGMFLSPGSIALTTYPDGTTFKLNCMGTAGTNGAVVVNLVNNNLAAPNNQLPHSTGSATPGNSYGFVKFRAKAK